MQVVVFRSRLRADANLLELEAIGERMYALHRRCPVSCRTRISLASDGESLTLVEFESEQTLLAWRDHPEIVRVQERGTDGAEQPGSPAPALVARG